MQTILGAGGAIGKELARILPEYTDRVRLVSRNPQKILPSNELMSADLTRRSDVERAVEGSDVAYLVAGLPYKTDVWREMWPAIMQNCIEACAAHDCRLVFFDNMYMYDRDHLAPMDENTPIRPTSEKGRIRAEIAQMLMDAVNEGRIKGLIARSADFYGPGKQQTSVLTIGVLERLAAGKSAQWFLSLDHKHSFTYTPDAGHATALLGNTDDAYGEIWHTPTAPDPPTGREWIASVAAELGVKPKTLVVNGLLMSALGLFIPALRELKEMVYQYDRDYVFVSDKFNTRFDFAPTPYGTGIKEVIRSDHRASQ